MKTMFNNTGYWRTKGVLFILTLTLAACSKSDKVDLKPGPIVVPSQPKSDEKDAYSNYLDHGITLHSQQLLSFDQLANSGWELASSNGVASLDKENKKEGEGAIKVLTKAKGWTTAVNTVLKPFSIDASDKRKSFIKLWVYINDITLLDSDKQGTAYDQQGTLYIQFSGHRWNHTLSGSGWHELELSFVNHNIAPENITSVNYKDLNSFQLRYQASPGLEIVFDDLRFVKYSSNYVVNPAPYNGRLLSNCDANELGGVVLGEWYGTSFDFENKKEGMCSLGLIGNLKHNEYRIYIGGFELPIDEEEDVLCFWLYVRNLSHTGTEGWVIELNEVQDVHEYECSFSLASENSGGIKNGWNFVTIPINKMRKQVDVAKFGNSILAKTLRLVVRGTNFAQNYQVAMDQVYIARKSDLPY